MSKQGDIAALNEELRENDLVPNWDIIDRLEDRGEMAPHVWKWDYIAEYVEKANQLIDLDEHQQGTRRAMYLINPSEGVDGTSHTLWTAIQSVLPNEVAKAHRHNLSAIRFVLDGTEGAVTSVNGEEFPMRTGDLILTPPGSYHDHINRGDEHVVWMDFLDISLTEALNISHFQNYENERHPADKPEGYHNSRFDDLRPMDQHWSEYRSSPPYRYAWEDSYETLQKADEQGWGETTFDGVCLEYVNPATGKGPTMPTFTHRLQKIRAGETTGSHRHISTEIVHVVDGSGRTEVGEETLEWEAGDTFIVPPGLWHAHQNPTDDEAIFFTTSDEPIFERLNLFWEETPEEPEQSFDTYE